MIDEKEVRHVAQLARLRLSDEEITRFGAQLNHILEYIEDLKQVDTANVEPMSHPLDVKNVFREDKAKPSLPREETLGNAPQQRDGFFLVPPVLEWTEE